MDMTQWGASWLSDMVGLHCSQDVLVINNSIPVPVKAALVDEVGRILPGAVTTTTEHTRFLFNSSEIAEKGVEFNRATIIKWGDTQFQTVMAAGRWYHFNDTHRTHLVVNTKHVSDSDS